MGANVGEYPRTSPETVSLLDPAAKVPGIFVEAISKCKEGKEQNPVQTPRLGLVLYRLMPDVMMYYCILRDNTLILSLLTRRSCHIGALVTHPFHFRQAIHCTFVPLSWKEVEFIYFSTIKVSK